MHVCAQSTECFDGGFGLTSNYCGGGNNKLRNFDILGSKHTMSVRVYSFLFIIITILVQVLYFFVCIYLYVLYILIEACAGTSPIPLVGMPTPKRVCLMVTAILLHLFHPLRCVTGGHNLYYPQQELLITVHKKINNRLFRGGGVRTC